MVAPDDRTTKKKETKEEREMKRDKKNQERKRERERETTSAGSTDRRIDVTSASLMADRSNKKVTSSKKKTPIKVGNFAQKKNSIKDLKTKIKLGKTRSVYRQESPLLWNVFLFAKKKPISCLFLSLFGFCYGNSGRGSFRNDTRSGQGPHLQRNPIKTNKVH